MSNPQGPKQSAPLGILCITLAFAFVAAMSAFGKAAGGVSTGVLVFFQNFISLILFAPWFLGNGLGELRTSRVWLHVLRAVAGLLSQVLMFVAVKRMPLVNAVLLANSAPLFIPLVAWLWLREHISRAVWTGLPIGFAGVILILRPGVELFRDPAAPVALGAALFSAFALVSVNKLSKTEPARRILFYYFLISSIAAAPFAIWQWKPPTAREWLFLAGIGVSMAVSQMLIVMAYRHAAASRIAPFNYSVVIFSGFIGWLVWGNAPGLLSFLGVLLVTAGGVWSTRAAFPSYTRTLRLDRLLEPSKVTGGNSMSDLVISGDEIRCVLPWQATVGESPVWHPLEANLYWVDIQGKRIHRFHPASGSNQTFDLPEIVTSIALRAAGGLVLTLTKQFAIFEPETRELRRLGEVESELANNRFNDGKCDPQGRFWAGTMDAVNWSAPSGNLFRLDATGAITRMQSKVICSNGTGWSPDGRRMYYTESFRYAIFVYDFDAATGAISSPRPFVAFDSNGGGFPDGMTVDEEGFVWSNVVGLGQIHRYDPAGKMERMVQLPVPRATDCTFGGPDLRTLYVTSARETMTPQQLAAAPLSGSIFAIDCDVRGLPSTEFQG